MKTKQSGVSAILSRNLVNSSAAKTPLSGVSAILSRNLVKNMTAKILKLNGYAFNLILALFFCASIASAESGSCGFLVYHNNDLLYLKKIKWNIEGGAITVKEITNHNNEINIPGAKLMEMNNEITHFTVPENMNDTLDGVLGTFDVQLTKSRNAPKDILVVTYTPNNRGIVIALLGGATVSYCSGIINTGLGTCQMQTRTIECKPNSICTVS